MMNCTRGLGLVGHLDDCPVCGSQTSSDAKYLLKEMKLDWPVPIGQDMTGKRMLGLGVSELAELGISKEQLKLARSTVSSLQRAHFACSSSVARKEGAPWQYPQPIELRMKHVRFVGFTSWTQHADKQTNEEQDLACHKAAASAFPGSRAATAKEFLEQLIEGLPPNLPDRTALTGEGSFNLNVKGTKGHGKCRFESGKANEDVNSCLTYGSNRQCICVIEV